MSVGFTAAAIKDSAPPFGELHHPVDRTLAETCVGRVLIVEDDLPLAENLQEILEISGYQAVAVPSAEAALTEVTDGSIGFIVTDHRLPGMSGAAFLRAVRSAGRTIPSVITTAWITDTEADAVAESGLTELLPKPIDIGRLLSSVQRALRPEGRERPLGRPRRPSQ